MARGSLVTVTLALVSCAQLDGAADDTSQPLGPWGSSCSRNSECADLLMKGGYYVAGPERCAVIDYDCPLGEEISLSACGCGCVPTGCPDPTDPEGEGYRNWSNESCDARAFTCAHDEVRICSACGSGCRTATCPDPRSRDVHYLTHDLDVCARVDFACADGEMSIPPSCGCGCMKRPSVTPDFCEASGGRVVHDIGDGAVHRSEYRCPSGAPPSATVFTLNGVPMSIAGAVCCPIVPMPY